jgi:hypothetical protein
MSRSRKLAGNLNHRFPRCKGRHVIISTVHSSCNTEDWRAYWHAIHKLENIGVYQLHLGAAAPFNVRQENGVDQYYYIDLKFLPTCHRQSPTLAFSFSIEGFLGRWRDGNVSSLEKNRAESLQNIPSPQPAFLWRFWLVEKNPPNGGCEQFRLGTENDRDQA